MLTAERLARQHQASLTFVHVMTPLEGTLAADVDYVPDMFARTARR